MRVRFNKSRRGWTFILAALACIYSLISLLSLMSIGYAKTQKAAYDVKFVDARLVDSASMDEQNSSLSIQNDNIDLDLKLFCPGSWAKYRAKVQNVGLGRIQLIKVQQNVDKAQSDIKITSALPALHEYLDPSETCEFELIVLWDKASTKTELNQRFKIELVYAAYDDMDPIPGPVDSGDKNGVGAKTGDYNNPLMGFYAICFAGSFILLILLLILKRRGERKYVLD